MSEDLTKNLPSSFEERVLAELAAIRQENAQTNAHLSSLDSRLTSLEDRVLSIDKRLISLEDRVLSIDSRLISLEDKVDARLRETRPIWEGVLQRLTGVESELNNLNRQFRSLIADLFQMRVRIEKLEDSQPTA